MAVPDKSLHANATSDRELDALRARNKVRLVEEREEGCGVAQLPNGVYGFSYAPQQDAPLFTNKMFRNFEVHKLADGAIHVIGFVTEKERAQLSPLNEQIEVKLYPDPYEGSVNAVEVPLDCVTKATGPSREDGNFLKLSVAPAGE